MNSKLFVNKFDLIQSNFCLESSTDDISEFKRMLENIFSYMKPNGVLLMTALEGAVAYKVGEKYFPAIYLDKELIREYLEEAGFKIEEMDKVNAENSDSSKYHGFLFIKAKKNIRKRL
jgi:predicted methyltransferase